MDDKNKLNGFPTDLIDKMRSDKNIIENIPKISKENSKSNIKEELRKFLKDNGMEVNPGEKISITSDGYILEENDKKINDRLDTYKDSNIEENMSKEESTQEPKSESEASSEELAQGENTSELSSEAILDKNSIKLDIDETSIKYYRDCMLYGKPYTEDVKLLKGSLIIKFRDKYTKDALVISKKLSNLGIVNDAELILYQGMLHLAIAIVSIEIHSDGKSSLLNFNSKKIDDKLAFIMDLPSFKFNLFSKAFDAFNNKIKKLEEECLKENF